MSSISVSILFVLLVAARLRVSQLQSTPEDQHCEKPIQRAWILSLEHCRSMDLRLARLSTMNQMQRIRDTMKYLGHLPNNGILSVWTSGHDLFQDGDFRWFHNNMTVSPALIPYIIDEYKDQSCLKLALRGRIHENSTFYLDDYWCSFEIFPLCEG